MSDQQPNPITRRRFVKSAAAGAAATLAAPAIVTTKKAEGAVVVGSGEHRYEADHDWLRLPDAFTWQTAQGCAVDSEGLLYVIHEGRFDQRDHPSIFVFDQEGKHVRSFGAEFQGGGHGIEVRNEGGQDFLYVTAYQQQRSFAKLDTKGELVWRQGAPMESGLYPDGEDQFPRESDNPWGRDRFLPTNIAFLPDGGFVLADGYGAFRMHRYDAAGEWVSMFGEIANDTRANGTFHLPHGVWLDERGDEPLLAVADRVLDRLQWFTVDGEHRRTQAGFRWPANVDTWRDLMVVPELFGRVSLLDGENNVVAILCDNLDEIAADKDRKIRVDESRWRDGRFIHPHDACFDADGNLYVAEWVHTGRVTKLRRLS